MLQLFRCFVGSVECAEEMPLAVWTQPRWTVIGEAPSPLHATARPTAVSLVLCLGYNSIHVHTKGEWGEEGF